MKLRATVKNQMVKKKTKKPVVQVRGYTTTKLQMMIVNLPSIVWLAIFNPILYRFHSVLFICTKSRELNSPWQSKCIWKFYFDSIYFIVQTDLHSHTHSYSYEHIQQSECKKNNAKNGDVCKWCDRVCDSRCHMKIFNYVSLTHDKTVVLLLLFLDRPIQFPITTDNDNMGFEKKSSKNSNTGLFCIKIRPKNKRKISIVFAFFFTEKFHI